MFWYSLKRLDDSELSFNLYERYFKKITEYFNVDDDPVMFCLRYVKYLNIESLFSEKCAVSMEY